MSGYVFISNSTKPTEQENNSRESIELSNVSRPCLEEASRLGYEVFLGVNRNAPESLKCELPIHLYDSHTYRSLTAFKDNRQAYDNLYNLAKNNHIDVIHCNTPVGGLIGRLVGKRLKVAKVIYTAHGFHFYKGNLFIKNTIFKTAERIMAHWTDAIITMNQEDYEAAQKFKLKKGGKVYFVHGVGIDLDKFKSVRVDKNKKRKELGLAKDDIVIITSGDLIKRKNHALSLNIIAKCNDPKIKYLICGSGPELEHLKQQANQLGIEEQVFFLGHRKDMAELLIISDIFLFTSSQEGLPRSLMEAMATGLPCIVSKVRGNVDLIKNGEGGYCCDTLDEYADAIRKTAQPDIKKKFKKRNLEVIKDYDIIKVKQEIKNIYENIGL